MTLRDDALKAGDIKWKPGDEVPLETDGTGEKGYPVVFAANGQVTPAADAGDAIGQLGDTPRWDGQPIRVVMAGPGVVGDVSEAVEAGDYLVPDGTGGFRVLDTAGGDTEFIHLPRAMHDAASGENVVMMYR